MSIARYLNETADNADRFLSGVPRRDLTDEEFNALAPHLQRSVDASGLYRKTKPRPAASDDVKDGDTNG